MKTAARPSDQDLGNKQDFGEALGLGAAGEVLLDCNVLTKWATRSCMHMKFSATSTFLDTGTKCRSDNHQVYTQSAVF